MGDLTHLNLLSALTLMGASAIPAYMAFKMSRRRTAYLPLSVALTLTLLVHGLHHAFRYLGMVIPGLAAGLASALFAISFAITYLVVWRSVVAQP